MAHIGSQRTCLDGACSKEQGWFQIKDTLGAQHHVANFLAFGVGLGPLSSEQSPRGGTKNVASLLEYPYSPKLPQS